MKINRHMKLHITLRDTWEDKDGMIEFDPETSIHLCHDIQIEDRDEINYRIQVAFKEFYDYIQDGVFDTRW